jgi:hypothetical protein
MNVLVKASSKLTLCSLLRIVSRERVVNNQQSIVSQLGQELLIMEAVKAASTARSRSQTMRM